MTLVLTSAFTFGMVHRPSSPTPALRFVSRGLGLGPTWGLGDGDGLEWLQEGGVGRRGEIQAG
eukprot:759321-Amorphochlora_amoeboformis.AAC.1